MTLDRYVCIHGHFYQPPRENPWLEAVQTQDSAYPYHDWNERVTWECYGPNSAARILGDDGRIASITNNYRSISFDFGPTLLAWLQANHPRVYGGIVDADRIALERFSGHGPAMAHCYNHMIMPLATPRDQRTQVAWGVRDFQHRFGREPEGMWLPETAVDFDTLEAIAAAGIRFTVLAPRQFRRVRRLDAPGRPWTDVDERNVDTHRPYRVTLPSGRTIAVFCYDGAVARAVAFEGLLHSGDAFADRLLGAFGPASNGPQLVSVATDGESYGHHHRHGEMALAYALRRIERSASARITVFGEFLAAHPPVAEAEIVARSSWSCEHGVERWRADCGCRAGRHSGWRQGWRGPLRAALDWLRDELADVFESDGASVFADPWAARDAYIDVVLDRSRKSVGRFLEEQSVRPAARSPVKALKLLELQRHTMLMYTSCGWFFEDLSGIETVQILQYAARVIELAGELLGVDLERPFLARLAKARSNVAEEGDGRSVYSRRARPAALGLLDIAAHCVVAAELSDGAGGPSVPGFAVVQKNLVKRQTDGTAGTVGRIGITSRTTLERIDVAYTAVRTGDDVRVGVLRSPRGSRYEQFKAEALSSFDGGGLSDATRAIERRFGTPVRSTESLLPDERRRFHDRTLAARVIDPSGPFAASYERDAPAMRHLASLAFPLPAPFLATAGLYLDTSIKAALGAPGAAGRELAGSLAVQATQLGISLDTDRIAYQIATQTGRAIRRLADAPDDCSLLEAAADQVAFATGWSSPVDLWETRAMFAWLLERVWPGKTPAVRSGDPDGGRWATAFRSLGDHLGIGDV